MKLFWKLVVAGLALLPALAQAQELVYVSEPVAQKVWIIDTATNVVVTFIDVDVYPAALVAAPDGTRLYVRHEPHAANVWHGLPLVPDTVSVVDTATNTVAASVPVGAGWLSEMAIKPDGRRVYVANDMDNTVTVFDTLTNAVLTTIAVTLSPWGMAAAPDGLQVYVANYPSGGVQIINTATNSLDPVTIPTGCCGDTIAFKPDGTRAYVANWGSGNVSVIDTAAKAVIASVGVPWTPSGVTVAPDGNSAWVASFNGRQVTVIDTATNTVTASVPFAYGRRPSRIGFTADGSTAYVVTEDGVDVIDTATLVVTTTLLAGHPMSGVALATVQAPPPEEQIADLTDDVAALVSAGNLNKGQGNALTKKLTGALEQLAKGKVVVAMNRLIAFIHQTQSLIDDGVLTAAEGQPLIDAANAAISAILEAG